MLTNNTKRALISFFGRGTHGRSREDMVFAILTGPTQLKNDTKYQPSPGFWFTAAWQHLTQKLLSTGAKPGPVSGLRNIVPNFTRPHLQIAPPHFNLES